MAGGGGKGMRRVDRGAELESAFRNAASEAERSFRNAEIYVEKLIERPRHIEIQLLGDRHGNMVHLGERECSIQRRHQKVMEECPSPLVALHPEMRHAMGEAAIRAARAAGYYNAGTVEFLVDQDRRFYFLEMNTRLQVEHPVTELVTGLDLVKLQVEIAAGARLPFTQEEVAWRGSAIECRIYAEDPYNDFLPYPGKLTRLTRPLGPGIRLDGCVYDGWTVPMEYDPLLAKLAVWAATREDATERMIRALREYDVGGIRTNIGFFRQILEDAEFRAAHLHTGFIEEFFQRHRRAAPARDLAAVAALAAALHTMSRAGQPDAPGRARRQRVAGIGTGRTAAMKLDLTINGTPGHIEILAPAPACRFRLGDGPERDARRGDCPSPASIPFCWMAAATKRASKRRRRPGGGDRWLPLRNRRARSAPLLAQAIRPRRRRRPDRRRAHARQSGARAGRARRRGGSRPGPRGGGSHEDAERNESRARRPRAHRDRQRRRHRHRRRRAGDDRVGRNRPVCALLRERDRAV